MKNRTALLFIVALIAFVCPDSWADGFARQNQTNFMNGRYYQPGGGPPPGRRGKDPHGTGRLEKFRIAKMIELLDLTKEQQDKLIPEFRMMRREMRKLHFEKREHVVALTQGIRYEKITEVEINEHIAAIEKINREIPVFSEQFIKKVRTFLTAEQVGKFVLFAEKFDLLLLDRIRGFHERQLLEGDQPTGDSN